MGSLSLIPDYGDPAEPAVRAKYGTLESVVSLVGNAGLLVSKLAIGLLISSIALFGDSMNHLTDVGISIVLICGFRLTKKEADHEHPYGHARAEQILSVAVATLIIVMGIAILLASLQGLAEPAISSPPIVSVFILVFAGVKEVMARFAFTIGRRIESRVLMADGWNHRFDAIISVVIAAGIYLTTIDQSLRFVDPVLGILVAVVIVVTGIKLVKESGDELLGRAPSPEVVSRVVQIAEAVEGVRDAHEVKVHEYGTRKVMSLHVSVEEGITAKDAHEIATEVEESIQTEFRVEPTVHIEPLDSAMGLDDLETLVAQTVERYEEILSSHNIRVTPRKGGGETDLHIIVDADMSVDEVHELVHSLSDEIRLRLEGFEVKIHVEPCKKECSICEEICSKGHDQR
jgi:cation diffusion facilitator family transporter